MKEKSSYIYEEENSELCEVVLSNQLLLNNKGIDCSRITQLRYQCSNATLTTVNLYNNLIANDGCKSLAFLLNHSPNITYLNIGSNYISCRGLSIIAPSILQHTALKVLILGSMNLTPKTNSLGPVQDLNNSVNQTVIILFQQILGCPSLVHLNLNYIQLSEFQDIICSALIENLSGNVAPRTLATSNIDQYLIVSTRAMLKELHIAGTGLSSSLTSLIAHGVCQSKTLLTLDLRDNKIEDNTFEELIRQLRDRNKEVTSFPLTCVKLNNLCYPTKYFNSFFQLFSYKVNITELHLSNCNLEYSSIKILADALLLQIQALRVVDLSNNNIITSSFKILCQGLLKSKIEVLILSGNPISDEGACLMGETFDKTRTNLKTLSLSNCHIKDKGGIILVTSLVNNCTLTHLKLNYNQFTVQGGISLAYLISKNRHLFTISIKSAGLSSLSLSSIETTTNRNRQSENATITHSIKSSLRKGDYLNFEMGQFDSENKDVEVKLKDCAEYKSNCQLIETEQEEMFLKEYSLISNQLNHLRETNAFQERKSNMQQEELSKYKEKYQKKIEDLHSKLDSFKNENDMLCKFIDQSKVESEDINRCEIEIKNILQSWIDDATNEELQWKQQALNYQNEIELIVDARK